MVPPLWEESVVIDPVGPIINPVDVVINPAIDRKRANPTPERLIRNDSLFVYQGIAFDANGIANQEVVR